jgi:hypothetical protein
MLFFVLIQAFSFYPVVACIKQILHAISLDYELVERKVPAENVYLTQKVPAQNVHLRKKVLV